MIRVILPPHLRSLAGAERTVEVDACAPVTVRTILDALEARYPMLLGTTRDQVTQQRRPLVRFFACGEDISLDPPDAELPEAIVSGEEPFFIIGAIAGGCGLPNGDAVPRFQPMRHWLIAIAVAALFIAAVSCEKTIYEPGEPEHGGMFLHGTPASTAP
jgi:sulfur-carrier protein